MRLRYKVLCVALPLAVITFLLNRVIWPDMAGMPGPTSAQIPLFMIISSLEALSFGLGVAFAVFAWKHAKAGDRVVYVSIIWLMVSWWPHDNMHRVNGMDNFAGLLRIEYTFHLTLIIAGFIVAKYFYKQISRSSS